MSRNMQFWQVMGHGFELRMMLVRVFELPHQSRKLGEMVRGWHEIKRID